MPIYFCMPLRLGLFVTWWQQLTRTLTYALSGGRRQLGNWHRTWAGPIRSFHLGTSNAKKQHQGRSIRFLGAAMAECQGQMAVTVASGFCGGGRSILPSQSPGIISADHSGCFASLIPTVFQPSCHFDEQPNSPPMHSFAI